MTGDKELNATLEAIDKGIIDFQDGIPEIQRRIYERLLLLQKELQIQGGTITNSAKNIRLLGRNDRGVIRIGDQRIINYG